MNNQRQQIQQQKVQQQQETVEVPMKIDYSEKYMDAIYEYRHVIVPKDLAKSFPKGRLLTELEWRTIGIQQSRGWENYAIHRPEPHILLFRRPLGTDPTTGEVVEEEAHKIRDDYFRDISKARR